MGRSTSKQPPRSHGDIVCGHHHGHDAAVIAWWGVPTAVGGAFDGRLDKSVRYNASLDATAITAEYNRRITRRGFPFRVVGWRVGSPHNDSPAVVFAFALSRAERGLQPLPTCRYNNVRQCRAIHHHYII